MNGLEPTTKEGQVLALLKECVTMKLTGPTPIEEWPDHLAKAMTADTVVVYGMAANMIGILIKWIFTIAPTVTDLLHHLGGPGYTLAEYHRDFFLSIPLQLMALKLLAEYLGRAGTVLREATWRLFLRGLGAEWVAPEPEIRVWVEGRSLNIEVPRPVDPDESSPGTTVV